jgi:superfamily II DNA or RNA helicase
MRIIDERTGEIAETMLRRWQQEALLKAREQFRRAANLPFDDEARTFTVSCTPGSGKTVFALALAKSLVNRGLIDFLYVASPSRPMVEHWKTKTCELIGYHLSKRSNNNLQNVELPFDVGGVAATYSQIASRARAHASHIHGRLAMFVGDEFHHMSEFNTWGKEARKAFEKAHFRVFLSGTPFRGDATRLPWARFSPEGLLLPDYVYTYKRAMKDKVCRPVVFHSYPVTVTDSRYSKEFAKVTDEDSQNKLLEISLDTKGPLIRRMIRDGHEILKTLRARGEQFAHAGGLLVARDQKHARECAKLITEITGEVPAISISDNEDAEDEQRSYENGSGFWIVSVKKIGEGVDIPRLMVTVYATNVTQRLFFRQVAGRVQRVIDPNGKPELGFILIPADPRLIDLAGEIEEDVAVHMNENPDINWDEIRHLLGKGKGERRKTGAEGVEFEVGAKNAIFKGGFFNQEQLDSCEPYRPTYEEAMGGPLRIEQIAFIRWREGLLKVTPVNGKETVDA